MRPGGRRTQQVIGSVPAEPRGSEVVTTEATPRPDTPSWLPVIPENFPLELTKNHSWVVWRAEPVPDRSGKWTKVPYQSNAPTRKASVTEPATWSSFSGAYMAYQAHLDIDGIGYVLHDEGVTGIDLDDCFADNGTLKPWASEIVSSLSGVYWERSPSGKGLRGLCRARLPPGRRKRRIDGCSVELYDDVRFLTLTGAVL
jgi:primase-polymerase (primpol)-like protein